MDRLSDKTAIVFGAGPNIGGTIAHFLAREGARTVVCDIDESAAAETVAFLEAKGLTASALQGDAADEDHVARAVSETTALYGAPDIIVNMAGKIHWSSVVDMELEGWLSCLTSFPTAAMLTTKHAAKAMIAAGKGGLIRRALVQRCAKHGRVEFGDSRKDCDRSDTGDCDLRDPGKPPCASIGVDQLQNAEDRQEQADLPPQRDGETGGESEQHGLSI